jgi:hypothetical protein
MPGKAATPWAVLMAQMFNAVRKPPKSRKFPVPLACLYGRLD